MCKCVTGNLKKTNETLTVNVNNVLLKKSKEKKNKKTVTHLHSKKPFTYKKIVKKRKIKKKKINSPPKWSKFNKKAKKRNVSNISQKKNSLTSEMSRKKPTKSKETCKVYLKFIEIKKNFIKMSSKNVTGCNLQYLM